VVRWRTLDVHGKRTFLESELPRIICPEHGKITAAVPWARHDDRFSRPFEEFAAWKAAHMPWTKAAAELRITWEALAGIVAAGRGRRRGPAGPAGGPAQDRDRREVLGQGQGKYLVIVTDHDAGGSRGSARAAARPPSSAFFDASARSGAGRLTHVSADGAEWIHDVVRAKRPAGGDLPGCVPRGEMGRGEARRAAPPPGRRAARRRAR
jgi:transposase